MLPLDVLAALRDAEKDLATWRPSGTRGRRHHEPAIGGDGRAMRTPVALGLTPTQIDALLRTLRRLIDGGARGMADASLGTANLAFLALKSLELDRLVADGDRDHTFLAVEELVHGRRSLKRHTGTPQVHIMC